MFLPPVTKRQPYKIHFAAMIGVAVDADLFKWWIPYYRRLKFDTYTVYLHASGDVEKDEAAEALFIENGFITLMLPQDAIAHAPVNPGQPGAVRSILFNTMAVSLPKRDFLATADGDEFQMWPKFPREYVDDGISIVTGRLIDCFDVTLHAPDPEKSLAENYPIEEFDFSRRWRHHPLNAKKICLAPAHFPIQYSGSHEMRRGYTDKTWNRVMRGPLDVLHYRWRQSAFLRVENRPDWNDDAISFLKRFFECEEAA